MGGWYWIGVCVGLGAAVGVLLAGVAGRSRAALAASLVLAAAGGAGIGLLLHDSQPGGWGDIGGGLIGGLVGAVGAAQVVRGALGRGGTRLGTAALVAGAAIAVAGVAWVPVLGYVEALALPALAARLRRRSPERYAGLRSLAKD
jgi:hypothetical protein